MINLTTANSALKTVYLDVLDNLLNVGTNPLFGKIKKTTQGVYGKEIKVLAPYGINGGVSATSETGELPKVSNNHYLNFTSELKNLYGRLEISDKAVRASQNSAGAFVNLLNDEMEGLIKSSAFNLSRMLYSDGSGELCEILSVDADKRTIKVSNINVFMEGMLIDIEDSGSREMIATQLEVVNVDRANSKIKVSADVVNEYINDGGFFIYVQNSKNNEITGVDALFNASVATLYGLSKSNYSCVNGLNVPNVGTLTEMGIIKNIDAVEEVSGGKVNFISCSSAVRRKYQELLIAANRNVATIDLGNGFKAIDFYGIPMVADKFVKNDRMYLLNTDDFTLHQMCDWEWMASEDGNILSQKAGYPVYTATLVKYANLICSRPTAQCRMSGITVN